MTVRQISTSEHSTVAALVSSFPFKPYRHYRALSRKAQDAVMLAEIDATLASPSGVVFLAEEHEGKPKGMAVARVLDWDSAFFGVPMGRLEYLLADEAETAVQIINGTVDALRSRGVCHVSARADVADIQSLNALESQGFRTMDALVTYITRPRKEPPRDVREVGEIRPATADDRAELLEITRDAYRGYKGRFHLDPHLDRDRADDFYVEWARQCLNGQMADTVLVSTGADGRLLGYLAFRRREPVSSVGGVAVFGGGLGACRPDAPGAYAGLIRAGTLWAHERDGVAECQTQNYNFPVIRIYEAVGAHYTRAEYTLHAWVGHAPSG